MTPAGLRRARAGLRAPALAASALAAAACAYFPSREEVFPPIPLTIGEPVVRDGETSYVLRGTGYELAAARREALDETRRALDDAARTYQRIFGAPPPAAAVLLVEQPGGAQRDSAAYARAGMPVVTVLAPAAPVRVQRRRGPEPFPAPAAGGTPAAAALAACWVERFERAGPAGRPLPAWLHSALVQAIADPDFGGDLVPMQLAAQLNELPHLTELFAASRPMGALAPGTTAGARPGARAGPSPDIARAPGPSGGGPPAIPMRRGKAPRLPAAALFDAQALSVAEYVMAREGARYFGELARRVRAGEPVDSVLAGARSLPRSVAGLDDSWRAWVADVGGGPGGRPGISRAPRGR